MLMYKGTWESNPYPVEMNNITDFIIVLDVIDPSGLPQIRVMYEYITMLTKLDGRDTELVDLLSYYHSVLCIN